MESIDAAGVEFVGRSDHHLEPRDAFDRQPARQVRGLDRERVIVTVGERYVWEKGKVATAMVEGMDSTGK